MEDSWKKEEVIVFVEEGHSIQQLANHFGIAPTSMSYRLKKMGLRTKGRSSRTWTDDQFMSAVKISKSRTEVMRKLRLVPTAGNNRTVNKYIAYFELDISHFEHSRVSPGSFKRSLTNMDIFRCDCDVKRSTVKKRILSDKLKPYICTICDNTGDWIGNPLVLILDHIDGDNRNHTLDNLRFLCPNCNAQQPTFCKGNTR